MKLQYYGEGFVIVECQLCHDQRGGKYIPNADLTLAGMQILSKLFLYLSQQNVVAPNA